MFFPSFSWLLLYHQGVISIFGKGGADSPLMEQGRVIGGPMMNQIGWYDLPLKYLSCPMEVEVVVEGFRRKVDRYRICDFVCIHR